MRRAGESVAREALGMTGREGRIAVLCGPGNNGGDGLVAAKLLAAAGREVAVGILGPASALRGDAAEALRFWDGAVSEAALLALDRSALIIDALFGAGLVRELGGEARALVERVNESRLPVLAVDVPSGVDGDTGIIRGVAVRATRTITFVRRKPGHLLLPGRDLCGPVVLADIGVPDATVEESAGALYANAPALWRHALPRPASDGHKYARGHLLVIAGGIEGVGAARLSARGGLRAGAGLVTIAAPQEALSAHASRGPDALMVRLADNEAAIRALLDDPRRNAAVIGPALGLDRSAQGKLRAALASDATLVIDADAMTLLAGRLGSLARASRRKAVVLTPHEGEFARLFKSLTGGAGELRAALQADKLSRALAASRITGAIVVLKGADTVIAAPDGRAAINENAPPWLATAGSGDVLAGMVGGLIAQRVPAWEAACAAVWLHGEAGRRAGRGLISDDLPEGLRDIFSRPDGEF